MLGTKKEANVAPFKAGVLLLNIERAEFVNNRLMIICRELSFPIYIKNEIATSKDKSKERFVNEYGRFYYAESADSLPPYFKTENVRKSFIGENVLVDLIINANGMHGEVDFMLDAKKLCRDKDTSEINRFLEGTQVVAWGSHYNGEQAVYYEFLDAETYPQFGKDNPKTDRVKKWLSKVC